MHAWNGLPAAQLEMPKGIGWWLLLIRVNLIVFYVTILFMVHILFSFFGMKNICQLIVRYACVGSLKIIGIKLKKIGEPMKNCLLYTSPSPRDRTRSRMPSSA